METAKRIGIVLSENETRNVMAAYTTAHPMYNDTFRLFGTSVIPTPFFNVSSQEQRDRVLSEIQSRNPEVIVVWNQ